MAKATARKRETVGEVIRLPDGASAVREGDALALRDAAGRLLVRYENGRAEIAAPEGDLILAAPSGRVVLKSALDVEVQAERDIVQHAARRLSITTGAADNTPQVIVEPGQTQVHAKNLEVQAHTSRLVTGKATILAQEIATTAKKVAQNVERYEITATRIVETAKDAFFDVADLMQSRIGRARTIVKGAYTLHAKRAIVASKEETKIDGKKVLLG
jgi:Protein of unknown function (DUF3540)